MTIEEILAVEDIQKKISLLKRGRKTPLPKVKELREEWDPDLHDVMNPSIRKPRKVLISEAEVDEEGKTIKPARYQEEDVTRIALPIEQDIVDIHTAFTVGKDPTFDFKAHTQNEEKLFYVIRAINRANKIRYHNKSVVRSWLSEQEVVEYWYTRQDTGFWAKISAAFDRLFGRIRPDKKLACTIWSPFRGDTLYPFFYDNGDYAAQSRAYTLTELSPEDGKSRRVNYFQTVTDKMVYTWKQVDGKWVADESKTFSHGFSKIPCIYGWRDRSLCHNIKPQRNRLEKVLSDYGDCIDYHFFPYLILKGELAGSAGLGNQDERRRMIKVMDDADAYYLTWDQTPEAIKLEITTLLENIYGETSTPRITFENMKSLGQVASGVAFKYMFMSTLLAVDNHAETIGPFLQRRYNFLASAIGSLAPTFKSASESIDLSVEVTPFTIENLKDKIEIAAEAKKNGFMSTKSGIIFIGMTDRVEEELEQIEAEAATAPAEPAKPAAKE